MQKTSYHPHEIGCASILRRWESRFLLSGERSPFGHIWTGDELTFVLTRHWRKPGLSLHRADFTDTQAIATISRITSGNFRLRHRLFVQIERILRINELNAISEDVVEAARSTLVIGAT